MHKGHIRVAQVNVNALCHNYVLPSHQVIHSRYVNVATLVNKLCVLYTVTTTGSHAVPVLQDFVLQLCLTLATHGAPEYAVGSLVTELVQLEGANWDATMVGLRSLRAILLLAPAQLAAKGAMSPAVSSLL